ncbi:DUF5672 family protein [Kingella negevensis]|nr:DUF5672 family protein [Kingella negevensis]MDK4679377.1 DUF5672 family protein [Kingella negevensis]MDK4682903.1 DUF5672 family protein [Kingella negevensis]MDK4685484.1 DUF5672 family protein [Kingella negevensis]MDK4689560.1 DUF5672 family protein [Kingella negevensis]MDK4691102.1 DUF5672 family protein [Kingella negevensis]
MNPQKSLTIVSVTGSDDFTLGSMYAIERSFQELRGKIQHLECLLISPTKPQNLPNHIQHIRCHPFTYAEYNLFMLFSLRQFIHTDFALTVQDDGWVLNGAMWRDDFFDYDYLGAPIPNYFCSIPKSPDSPLDMTGIDYWFAHPAPPDDTFFEPQNGGFSLRSKRLLDAPTELNLPASIKTTGSSTTEPIKIQYTHNNTLAEDLFLSVLHRKALEQHGLRFAPSSVALHFSCEYGQVWQRFAPQLNPTHILGAHFSSRIRLTSTHSVKTFTSYFPDKHSIETEFSLSRLNTLGYHIHIPKELNYTQTDLHFPAKYS